MSWGFFINNNRDETTTPLAQSLSSSLIDVQRVDPSLSEVEIQSEGRRRERGDDPSGLGPDPSPEGCRRKRHNNYYRHPGRAVALTVGGSPDHYRRSGTHEMPGVFVSRDRLLTEASDVEGTRSLGFSTVCPYVCCHPVDTRLLGFVLVRRTEYWKGGPGYKTTKSFGTTL